MYIQPHRKRIINADLTEKVLKVTKNGVYESPEHPYTRVEVNIPKVLKSIDITENGVYKSIDGFGEVKVNIKPDFSFAERGFKLKRLKYKGNMYLMLGNGKTDYPFNALKSSGYKIYVNKGTPDETVMFVTEKGVFVSPNICDKFSNGSLVNVSVAILDDVLIHNETIEITGDVTLFE